MFRSQSKKGRLAIICTVMLLGGLLLFGCSGDDGAPGPAGAKGDKGDTGPAGKDGVDGKDATATASVEPESCYICHGGVGYDMHQSVYDDYVDTDFTATVNSVASTDNLDGTFNVTVTFTITKFGLPYVDAAGLPSLEQMRLYTVMYDSATRMFDNSVRLSNGGSGVVPTGVGGEYRVTYTMDYAPESSNAEAYMYIADDTLNTEGMTLYGNVANAGADYGNVGTYVSAANVAGCEKCHGTPYRKHGYRAAAVAGLPDFASCKVCHTDSTAGGHEDWQILVDNPVRYAEIWYGDSITPEEEAYYAYKRNVKNDVHMSHAMEFPYPQLMANCATCHDGKLDMILTDEFFTAATCRSCHPVTGVGGTEPHRAPALADLWAEAEVTGIHNINQACVVCHNNNVPPKQKVAPEFKELHTGYDHVIYANAAGTRYSDIFTVSIDSASFANNKLTIDFSAAETGNTTALSKDDIVPTVMVGLYGYDSKDYIVGPHERDAARNRLLEFTVDGVTTNPRFEVLTAAGGVWKVTADLTEWADMITDGIVKRAEIAVTPELMNADDEVLALNAPSRTFYLATSTFDSDWSYARNNIVKVTNGCNTCHDALARTFHDPDRGGNIVVCRLCHITKSGGSHLEMQSRSIDSYVHAIHSFQAFDINNIDFTDDVDSMRYEMHIEHVYPNFTIKSCESCHVAPDPTGYITYYEVPDQANSMPGLFSPSEYPLTGWDRKIGQIPGYVAGPASRACGACHRANLIKEDNASGLVGFNSHTKQGGYLVEVTSDDEDSVLAGVIEKIMSLFK